MTFNAFMVYFVILFAATITPGPSMLLAMSHGVNHGLAKTMYSGLGNLTGNLLMALVSIIGLGAVLAASGVIFTIIKWIGVIYLIAIGAMLIFKPDREDGKARFPGSNGRKHRLFINGFIIALGNPKGILFFTALFPQFINGKSITPGLLATIFITLAIVAFCCYMLYALFGTRLNKLFLLVSFRKLFNRITGSIFVFTGVALSYTRK
jgi:threonine/homoserine/homoserine lactone efflux protein